MKKMTPLRAVGMKLRPALLGTAASLLVVACAGQEEDPEVAPTTEEGTPTGDGMDGDGSTTAMGTEGDGAGQPDCAADPTLTGCPDPNEGGDTEDDPALPDLSVEEEIQLAGFQANLNKYCGDCHGANAVEEGNVQGNFAVIDDFEEMVRQGLLVPGDSDASLVVQRLVDGSMPPAGVELRPSKNEADQMLAFIDNPALAGPSEGDIDCTGQAPIEYTDVFEEIQGDLLSLDVNDRLFARYLTLTDRYNSGLCAEEELDRDRWAMNKMVNMLSTDTRVHNPFPIDRNELIYRIDIRDYGWDDIEQIDGETIDVTTVNNVDIDLATAIANNDVDPLVDVLDNLVVEDTGNGWDAIVQASPYGTPFEGDQAAVVIQQTQSRVPILSAGALISVASLGGLYYSLIGIDRQLVGGGNANGQLLDDFLLENLALDIIDLDEAQAIVDEDDNDALDDAEEVVIQALSDERVIRAGTTKSQISNQDRVTERHEIGNRIGAYWQSFDFEANDNGENIFADPFGFAPGGIESIFTLPNGLLGYVITDANGFMVDDSNILIDTSQNDFVARTSISCSGCHAAGFIPVEDQVRSLALDSGQIGVLNAEQLEGIRDIYVPESEFADTIKADSDAYQLSLGRTDTPLNVVDPVSGTFIERDKDLDLRVVAGNLGVSESLLRTNLVQLDNALGVIAISTIDRDDFDPLFNKSLCILQVSSQNRPTDEFCDVLAGL